MATPSVSYTLRMPADLKRLLEREADKRGCPSIAVLVCQACWAYLEEPTPTIRVVMPSTDKGNEQSRLAGARVVGEDQPTNLKAQLEASIADIMAQSVLAPIHDHQPPVLCSYKELDRDTDQWGHCGKMLGHKGPHGSWRVSGSSF